MNSDDKYGEEISVSDMAAPGVYRRHACLPIHPALSRKVSGCVMIVVVMMVTVVVLMVILVVLIIVKLYLTSMME